MSIGKINASLVGGLTQETTLALANLNFDFALCKVEAPMEYQGLGECLSRRRRAAAESGNEHILARKLGALFSHTLPATPKLVRAYGKRATEIILESSKRESPSPRKDGVFGEWTGPDATSIWAAATSGTGAIAAHLLACMLARIWTASEAAAIWEEIIESRKLEIAESDPGTPFWQSQEVAAKIEVTKEQISRWDSSARSWLEIADKARMKQQKQLKLLVDNAGIPVNQAPTAYRSVMDAWTTALSTVEKLLEGVPQSINDGAVILALTSWHIFPDMFVIGAGSTIIQQNDPLYPKGTVITLGQSSRPPDATSDGVFWSLPLAFLKYYGDPVVRTRSLGVSTSRLTFSEVMQVVLGSMMAGWRDYARDLQQVCVNIISIADFITTNRRREPGQPRSWIQLLGESAESYLAETDSSQSHLRGLTMRGFRRYRQLLWRPEEEYPPLFGLTKLNTVLQLIDRIEDKVSFLRLVAQALKNDNHDNVVIRYRVPVSVPDPAFEESIAGLSSVSRAGQDLHLSKNPETAFEAAMSVQSNLGQDLWEGVDSGAQQPSKWIWEYASAIRKRQQPSTKKRKHTPSTDLTGHVRWTGQDEHFAESGEEYIKIDFPFGWDQIASPMLPGRAWDCVLGNADEAAIFKQPQVALSGTEELTHEHIDEALRCNWINRTKLIQLLDFRGEFTHPKPPQYLKCLRALAAAAEAYKLMPGATISTELFSEPLKDTLWIPRNYNTLVKHPLVTEEKEVVATQSLIFGSTVDPRLLSKPATQEAPQSPIREDAQDLRTYTLSRNQIFSCIAMFENRKVNLDPRILDEVMAISAGGSLYVAMPLICDPFDLVQPNEIKHITGNISKPGLSLMIPPMAPKMRKVDEDKWTLVNHAAFDGRLDDSFQHTSLHISFTGYQLPMMTAEHGYQGVEANFVETLVSVFDGHEWVADLNVLKALAMPSVSSIGEHLGRCGHKKAYDTPEFPLTSIDSWDELIDRPSNACIFRASGNWLARLSAVAVNAQQSLDTIVLEDGKKICWKCVGVIDKCKREDAQKRLLFVG